MNWWPGQYEVLGCLAHGGLGWLYLAMDRNLSNRWVVLKGLLNTTDRRPRSRRPSPSGGSSPRSSTRPSWASYNFVQHADRQTGEQAGYIVMEYVGGQSLRQLLQPPCPTPSHYLAAQVTAVRIQVSPRACEAQVAPDDLGQAGPVWVDRLKLDAIQLEYLTAEVLRAALGCAQAGESCRAGRCLADCSVASSPSAGCGSAWNAATAPRPGWPRPGIPGSSWSRRPTASARGPGV